MSAAVHNGPSFTGINGSYLQGGLIQSANSSVGKFAGCLCVCIMMVLCGRFCATGLSRILFFFFGTRVSHYKKKVPTLHTNISHSHRLAAEDGKKSGSNQRRAESVNLKKEKKKSVRACKGVERCDINSHRLVNLTFSSRRVL